MPSAANVTAGKPNVAGAIFRAPFGTTLPTSVVADLDNAFVEMGYASEDGITNTNTPETENMRAWGGDVVLTVQNSKDDTFKIKLIEALNENTLAAVYGTSNVTGTLATGIKIDVNADEAEEASWVIDMAMRNGAAKRIVIPDAKITEVGDIVYSDNEAVGYEITLTAMPDANGNNHIEYIKAA